MMWWVLVVGVLVTGYLLRSFRRSLKVRNYTDKYVFITGCDSGFGRQLAVHLDSLQFNVFAGCLTQKGRESLELTCSSRLKTCLINITKDENVQDAYNFVSENLPPGKGLWALVNNAGLFGNILTPEMLTKQDFYEMLEVNTLGPIEVTRTFLPLLRKESGRVVSLTSIMGRYPMMVTPYSVSKSALETYMDILRKEVRNQNIKVSIVQPGAFATNLMDRIDETMQKAYDRVSDELKHVYGDSHLETRRFQLKMSFFSSNLSWVVEALTNAIVARYPRIRYTVGWDAKLFFVPLAYLPEWISDAIVSFIEDIATKSGISIWSMIGSTTGSKGVAPIEEALKPAVSGCKTQ